MAVYRVYTKQNKKANIRENTTGNHQDCTKWKKKKERKKHLAKYCNKM